jgi:CheY-like chemotaxis protein
LARTLKTDDVEERVVMSRAGARILIVDDYPDALDIWALYLRALGYQVLTAADGAAAIAQAEQERPELIVLDLELPGISGFEVARRLRHDERTRHIPLIAATGYSHERQLEMAREAGFDRVLVKPVAPEELVEAIEQHLDSTCSVRQPNRSGVEQGHNNR